MCAATDDRSLEVRDQERLEVMSKPAAALSSCCKGAWSVHEEAMHVHASARSRMIMIYSEPACLWTV